MIGFFMIVIGVLLTHTRIDVLIGTGLVIIGTIKFVAALGGARKSYRFIDSLNDDWFLACVFGFWVELSILLRSYIYCWYGYMKPLSNYEQMSFAFDLLFSSYLQYDSCHIIRLAIIVTVFITLLCLFHAKKRAIRVYEFIDKGEVERFLRPRLEIMNSQIATADYRRAYYEIAYFAAKRLRKGEQRYINGFVSCEADEYQDPDESYMTLSDRITEIVKNDYELWKLRFGIKD